MKGSSTGNVETLDMAKSVETVELGSLGNYHLNDEPMRVLIHLSTYKLHLGIMIWDHFY